MRAQVRRSTAMIRFGASPALSARAAALLAALALAGCAGPNEARLSDGQVDASQRAECAAASSAVEPSLHGEFAEAPPPWCRDERDDLELWSSEDEDPLEVEFEDAAVADEDAAGERVFDDDGFGDGDAGDD